MTYPPMNGRQWAVLIAMAGLWGSSFIWNELALASFGPLTIVAGRLTLGALILLAIVRASGLRLPGLRAPGGARRWGEFFVMGGVSNVIPIALIVWGQGRIDAGLAAILNATPPLFLVGLTALSGEQPLAAGRLAAVAAGLAGAVVLADPGRGLGGEAAGILAVTLACLSYAAGSLYGRRFRDVTPLAGAAGTILAAAVLTLPAALLIEQPWTLTPQPLSLLAIGGLGLFSTALAYLLYFRLLPQVGPTNVSVVAFLVPVAAILFGALLFGEVPRPAALAGMGLIFIGLALLDGRPAAWLGRRLATAAARG